MGSVWRAEHLTLGTQVAVKFISAELAASSTEALERFRREARTAAQIRNPHVVQILDSGVTEQGTPYIVMEHLEGESLGERLEREGALDLRMAALVVVQVAKALHAAHRLGIVHRDVKPDNIFLATTEEGLVCKVLDFGVAKSVRIDELKAQRAEDTLVGTPEFMSPEQILEPDAVDYRADLWGLAAVAYCALTGAIPFDGEDLDELCLHILNGRFTQPSAVRPGEIPPVVDAWFGRAFHRHIRRRFGSAKEMARAFAKGVRGPSSERPSHGAPSRRRHGSRARAAAGQAGSQGVDARLGSPDPVAVDDPLSVPPDERDTARNYRQRLAAMRAKVVVAALAAAVLLMLVATLALLSGGSSEAESAAAAASRAASTTTPAARPPPQTLGSAGADSTSGRRAARASAGVEPAATAGSGAGPYEPSGAESDESLDAAAPVASTGPYSAPPRAFGTMPPATGSPPQENDGPDPPDPLDSPGF